MALGDDYATLTELKDRFGITDTNDDTRLSEALASASRGIESCTGRQFNDAGTATSRIFAVTTSRLAKVDDFHTTAGLVVATDPGDSGSYGTTWLTSDYELRPLNGMVRGQAGWPYWKVVAVGGQYFPTCTRRSPLRVTARWGWAAVPAPVKEATLILAEEIFKLGELPFGAGGYGEYGRIRARENPNVWMRIKPYVRDAVLVA